MATFLRPGIAGAPIAALPVGGGSSLDIDSIGSLDATLAALTLFGAGAVAVVGEADITLDDLTSDAAGALVGLGSADVTLDALTSDAAGALVGVGSADITLGSLAISAAAGLLAQGTLDVTLGSLNLISAGGSEITGSLITSTRKSGVSASPIASFPISGIWRAPLFMAFMDNVTVTATGAVSITAAMSKTLDNATISATGIKRDRLAAIASRGGPRFGIGSRGGPRISIRA